MICEKTAKKFCCDDLSLIENYELAINDTTQTWICHHILGEQYDRKYLIDNNLYENRPAYELRFVTLAEHLSLHNKLRCTGIRLSDIHKSKISNALTGIQFSESRRQAISAAKKGVPLSEEHKKALSAAKKGVPLSDAHKKALRAAAKSQKVLQFTKLNELIKEYNSLNEASSITGIRYQNISACCRGITKSAGGFIWKYA